MPTPVIRLFEAHLSVADLDRSVAFYREQLGLELAQVIPARSVAFLWIGPPGHTMVGLWAAGSGPQKTTTHIAFAASLEDVLAAPPALRLAGIVARDFDGRPTDEPVVLGWMPAASVYFHDPDGHLLEYIAMLPDDPRPDVGVVTWREWTAVVDSTRKIRLSRLVDDRRRRGMRRARLRGRRDDRRSSTRVPELADAQASGTGLVGSMQDVSIRPARLDEQTMLESLQRRASLSNPGDREALLANPDAIALPIEQIAEGCVFVAERDGVVAGFAAVVPRPDGGAELDALFVEPHFWKRGIGRRLVDHIADVARVRTASFLHVIGNPHAEGFYVSCGFRVTGTVNTRFGVGLAMRRSL